MMIERDWRGCYTHGWTKRDLCPEAFSHPAKFAKGLISRIVEHGLERGYWRAGDLVADPFCGVCCGGIVCAYHGLRFVGVELENRFVLLAQENIALHRQRLEALGAPLPIIIQGDSRNFAALVGQAAAVVTSPPWAQQEGANAARKHADPEAVAEARSRGYADGTVTGHYASKEAILRSLQKANQQEYGCAPGQVASLREGTLDGGGIDASKLTGNPAGEHSQAKAQGYGASPGQLCRLPEGSIQAAITSPPYAGSEVCQQTDMSKVVRKSARANARWEGYGEGDGQLARLAEGRVDEALDLSGKDGIIVADTQEPRNARKTKKRSGRAEASPPQAALGAPSGATAALSSEDTRCVPAETAGNQSAPRAAGVGDVIISTTEGPDVQRRQNTRPQSGSPIMESPIPYKVDDSTSGGAAETRGGAEQHGSSNDARPENATEIAASSAVPADAISPFTTSCHATKPEECGTIESKICSHSAGLATQRNGNPNGVRSRAFDAEPSIAPRAQRLDCAAQTAAASPSTRPCADGTRSEPPDDYWRACAKIYEQVHLALKPGGVLCCVVKGFIRKGVYVDLPADTLKLLTALGFEPVERIRAMLVSEQRHAGLWGEHKVKCERKSFFRRLAEAKGSPPIDFETVLFCRKAKEA